jgi:hypothetical protein
MVAGDIDLADERLLQRGRWDWGPPLPAGHRGRRSVDAAALAGFRCEADEIVLRFARGPGAADALVTLDGQVRRIPLADGEVSLETVRFGLPRGPHTVVIAPDTPAALVRGGGAATGGITWMGGHAGASAPLAFRVDPSLADYAGDVERYGTGKARITAVELLDWATLAPVTELAFGQRVRLRLHAERLAPAGPRLEFSFIVRDRNRIDLFGSTTIDHAIRLDPSATRYVVELAFDVRLGPGSYSILVSFVECSEDLQHRVPMDQIDMAKVFTVIFDPRRPVWYIFDQPTAATAHVE